MGYHGNSILPLRGYNSKPRMVTPIFHYGTLINMFRYKQKLKVALSPFGRSFLNFAKKVVPKHAV